MFIKLDLGTFRVVCEGDVRSREDRMACLQIVKERLRPVAKAGDPIWAPDPLSVPVWAEWPGAMSWRSE